MTDKSICGISFDMKLERKSLSRREWKWIEKAELAAEPVENAVFSGTAGLLYIQAVSAPLVVPCPAGKMVIADAGYRWLQLAPENAHWWLTVLIDREDRLLESYFDITRENDFSDPLAPAFYDMKLDVVVAPRGAPRILDEEELLEALTEGLISPEEYTLAQDTAGHIITWYKEHREAYYTYLANLYGRLSQGRKLRY